MHPIINSGCSPYLAGQHEASPLPRVKHTLIPSQNHMPSVMSSSTEALNAPRPLAMSAFVAGSVYGSSVTAAPSTVALCLQL